MSEPKPKSLQKKNANQQDPHLKAEGSQEQTPPTFQLKAGNEQVVQRQSPPEGDAGTADKKDAGATDAAPKVDTTDAKDKKTDTEKVDATATKAGKPIIPEKELMGDFGKAGDFKKHHDFVEVADDKYLRREAAVAFRMMQNAAEGAGHKVELKSATRDYYAQKSIWDGKWKGTKGGGPKNDEFYNKIKDPQKRAEAIMQWSSMPGTSRHHWGTDVDINSMSNGDWAPKTDNDKLHTWMMTNAPGFGWCQTYDKKGAGATPRTAGYNEEPWHWSYIPMASQYQAAYMKHIENKEIKGFEGSDVADKMDVKTNYVDSIAADCDPSKVTAVSVQGSATITAKTLTVREKANTKAKKLTGVKKDDVVKYYQIFTAKDGKVWLALEEGWILVANGEKKYTDLVLTAKTKVDKAKEKTTTPEVKTETTKDKKETPVIVPEKEKGK